MKKSNFLKESSCALLFLFFSITGCSNTEGQMKMNPLEETILKEQALGGDEDAYARLSSFYVLNLNYDAAYYISLLVANKYQNKEAYATLSWCLLYTAEPNDSYTMLKSLDRRTRFLCLYYLLKAKELDKNGSDAYYRMMLPEFTSIPSSSVFLDSLKDL